MTTGYNLQAVPIQFAVHSVADIDIECRVVAGVLEAKGGKSIIAVLTLKCVAPQKMTEQEANELKINPQMPA